MDPLTTVERLAAFLGVASIANADQAELLIGIASSTVRDYTGQELTAHADDELVMRGTWQRELWLPQRPVTAVTSLKVDGQLEPAEGYKWTKDGRVTRYGWGLGGGRALDGPDWQEGGHWGGDSVLIEAVYSHGYEELPASVEGVVLELCRRATNHPDAGVVQSRTTGPYTITYSTQLAQELSGAQSRRLQKYTRSSQSLPALRP